MSSPRPRGALGASTVVAIAICGLSACNESPTTPRVSIGTASAAKASASTSTSVATFDDGTSNKLRSDGAAYPAGDPCVTSVGGSAGGGVYQLRTIANTVPCKAETRGNWRFFTFDVGTTLPDIDLDQDGLTEAIEAAPARFLARDAFARGTTSTPVTIYVLEVLAAPGATTQNAKWSISYRKEPTVRIIGALRVIEALPADATADVFGGDGIFVKTVSLPFKLTLSP